MSKRENLIVLVHISEPGRWMDVLCLNYISCKVAEIKLAPNTCLVQTLELILYFQVLISPYWINFVKLHFLKMGAHLPVFGFNFFWPIEYFRILQWTQEWVGWISVFSMEVSSLGWCFPIKNTLVKSKQMTQPSKILPRNSAKNKQVNIGTLTILSFHALQERHQRITICFLSSKQSPVIGKLSDKQSGLSIWPYCFHPLISLVLTVLMRKQMHEAANYLHLASEQQQKKTAFNYLIWTWAIQKQ